MKKQEIFDGLTEKDVLIIRPKIAKAIGLNESVALQQLKYWLENPKMGFMAEGRKWIRNSYKQWRETNFPFWTEKIIRKTFDSLVAQDLVLKKSFPIHQFDKTLSWTMNNDLPELEVRAVDVPHRADGSAPGGSYTETTSKNYINARAPEVSEPVTIPTLPGQPLPSDREIEVIEAVGTDDVEDVVMTMAFYCKSSPNPYDPANCQFYQGALRLLKQFDSVETIDKEAERFAERWKNNPQYEGKPAVKTFMQEIGNEYSGAIMATPEQLIACERYWFEALQFLQKRLTKDQLSSAIVIGAIRAVGTDRIKKRTAKDKAKIREEFYTFCIKTMDGALL